MSCSHYLIEADLRAAYNTYVGRRSALNRATGASGQHYMGWGKWNQFYVNVGVSKIGTPYLMFSIKKPYKDLVDGHIYPHQILLFSNPGDKSFTCGHCKEFKTVHDELTDVLQEVIKQIKEAEKR